jgi:hypothetical protein
MRDKKGDFMMNDMADFDHAGPIVISVPSDLILDHSKYASELRDADIPEEKVREILDTLWAIMRLFVECGFSVDVSGRATMEIFNQAARGAPKDET